jgi:hypothetical protein
MGKGAWRGIAGALALAACTLAHGETPEARAAYKATMKTANADYNAARAHCRTLSRNPRTVCIAEAKAALRKAEADAAATLHDTERARADARVTGAKADYQVDKAKCGDRKGDERKACIKEARARQSEAMSESVKQERAPTAAAAAKAPAIPHTKTP